MYAGDSRFSAHYEGIAPGLARYVSDAIAANVVRAGGR
ncbi:MAG: TipAS antibiotic-recognition domain-containing protein [Actinomycetota bacterium]|nr:TipAS antibiotic-recognition domain-containing protein [Actinomycetota bacterium]